MSHHTRDHRGENNHTGKPMVNPGKDKVVIYGTPTFPKEGNGLGFPSGGTPWSVDSGKDAIEQERILLKLTQTKSNWVNVIVANKF